MYDTVESNFTDKKQTSQDVSVLRLDQEYSKLREYATYTVVVQTYLSGFDISMWL